jgi:hypothetical protein
VAHVSVYQIPHAQGLSDMSIRINNTLHLLPPGQAVEKGLSASLRFNRLAPTYWKEFASARRFLARLASKSF